MRYLSVCSGIEAASVAWEPLGWKPVAFSEIDPFASAVLRARFPSVPNLGSMEDFNGWDVGAIDVLVGGTPCQSFSVAGLRGGIEDARGNLALVYARMARKLRPRWVIWENVPGVLSAGDGRDFGSIVGALVECGYSLAWRVLDAQHFGVPQRRRRVFVVGYLGAGTGAAEVLFEPSSLRWIACENGQSSGGMDLRSDSRCYSVTPLSGQGSRLQTVPTDVASGLTSVSLGESTERGIRILEQTLHAVECDLDADCSCDAEPSRIRRLTPREVERCFGFPDDHTKIQWEPESRLDAARFRALGNSMAVPVMRWLGERIQAVQSSHSAG